MCPVVIWHFTGVLASLTAPSDVHNNIQGQERPCGMKAAADKAHGTRSGGFDKEKGRMLAQTYILVS